MSVLTLGSFWLSVFFLLSFFSVFLVLTGALPAAAEVVRGTSMLKGSFFLFIHIHAAEWSMFDMHHPFKMFLQHPHVYIV